MTTHRLPTRRLPGVQQSFIGAREIIGDVLCLAAPPQATQRTYCTVLAISPINFLLKAEEEQDALVERYRALLKALTFPVQILVRHQRLDLHPYLARLRAQVPASAPPTWGQLAAEVETLLAQMGSRRTLVERRCYLVIPAPRPLHASGWSLRRRRRQGRLDERRGQALQDLAIRVEQVQTQIAALGLRSRRVGGAELAQVYQRCVSPARAFRHPLLPVHLASLGRLPHVRWQTRAEDAEDLTDAPMPATEEPPRRGRRRPAGLPAPDFVRLADLLAPASLVETPDALEIDHEYVRTLVVTAFPHEVSTGGWLAPLLLLDDMLDLCLHLHPQNQAAMLRMLKRRRVGYASARHFNHQQGRLDDPTMDAAQNDVTRLLHHVASGDERLFEVSFLVLLRAPSRAALEEKAERLLSVLQTIFLDAVAHAATFEQAQAFRSCLPGGSDELGRTITVDATSVATTFPFMSNALTMPGGTFLGMTGTGEPVLLDPWDSDLENPHAFLGGVTGAGKSYLGKLWIERGLLVHGQQGERVAVIDPDGEYTDLASALAGSVVHIAAGSAHHLNPFDLVPPGCDLATYLVGVQRLDRLAEKIQDLHSLLDLLLADHGSVLLTREKALLDRALYEVYRRAGISSDPRSHFHQPPLLRDLSAVLKSAVCGPDEWDLGGRLSRYVEGSLAGLFASQTTVPLDAPLLVWDVRDLRGDLRPVGIFLIADTLWTQAIYQSHVRRALYIDEAASLIEHAEGGRFLATLSRRARKRYLRLVVMTQNPEAFVQDQWGSVVAANAAIKVLKKQDRTSVRAVAARFGLTAGEEQRLLTFGVQEALLLAGDRRVLLTVQAGPKEHALITTNPVERAEQASSTEAAPELPAEEQI